jgi:hypothetical protein
VVTGCDTCTHHIDSSSSGSKTDTTKTILADTVPFTMTIYGDSSFIENKSSLTPASLAVVIKNKEGNFIKGASVVFSPAPNSGSLDHDTVNTDDQGVARALWTLNPLADSGQTVIAKVNYKNTNLSVSFSGLIAHDTVYNYTGTITMDSTNMPGGAFIGFYDSTNAPDPFTISSDLMALMNGVPYPFELDGIINPILQPGEHGVGGSASMTINQIAYGLKVSYEVGGFTIMETSTVPTTFTGPDPCTVTMYWQIRGGAGNYSAYLLETVSSPTKGTFTNGRTGKIVMTSTQMVIH